MEQPHSPGQRMLSNWVRAEEHIREYLETLRGPGHAKPGQDPKTLYESWRVFSIVISCLKRVQEGHAQSQLEVQREARPEAEEENGAVAEILTRRMDEFFSQMRENPEDEDSDDPKPD